MQTVAHSGSDARHAALLAELRDGLARLQPKSFSRSSLEAFLNGVGLELDRWTPDDVGHYAVGVCVPMQREM